MKQRLAFAFIMGIITTGTISFTIASINVGYTPDFLKIWLRSWSVAYIVVVPVIFFIGPAVQKLVGRMFSR